MTRTVPLFIDGEFRESQATDWVEVLSLIHISEPTRR